MSVSSDLQSSPPARDIAEEQARHLRMIVISLFTVVLDRLDDMRPPVSYYLVDPFRREDEYTRIQAGNRTGASVMQRIGDSFCLDLRLGAKGSVGRRQVRAAVHVQLAEGTAQPSFEWTEEPVPDASGRSKGLRPVAVLPEAIGEIASGVQFWAERYGVPHVRSLPALMDRVAEMFHIQK